MQFCSQCAAPVESRVPDGDNRPRFVCTRCAYVHYQNPRMVVGCVPEYQGAILLCKRSIEPRYGYWTLPAGFMELGETVAAAALRETWEEALARVELGPLIALVDVVHAGQVHAFFAATLPQPDYGAGEETLETRLFEPDDIPWDDLAFPSVRVALECYFENQRRGADALHMKEAPRIRIS
jgi:ADP-ribose pyrophosphatase YjhB (NUDIX family)